MGLLDSNDVDADDARQLAVKCLTPGNFDGRDVNGAMANALESIAWSLIGLSKKSETNDSGREGLDDALHRIGLLRVEQ